MQYKINRGERYHEWLDYDAVEKKYNAKYVGDFCLRTKSGGWSEDPAAIFWQETPPNPLYSNYFGIIRQFGTTYITSGDSTIGIPIDGVVADDGEIIYSRFRHDFRASTDKTAWIDGGRDYTRTGIPHKPLTLTIKGPNIVVVEDELEIMALYEKLNGSSQ